jgi:hypothetical protein
MGFPALRHQLSGITDCSQQGPHFRSSTVNSVAVLLLHRAYHFVMALFSDNEARPDGKVIAQKRWKPARYPLIKHLGGCRDPPPADVEVTSPSVQSHSELTTLHHGQPSVRSSPVCGGIARAECKRPFDSQIGGRV